MSRAGGWASPAVRTGLVATLLLAVIAVGYLGWRLYDMPKLVTPANAPACDDGDASLLKLMTLGCGATCKVERMVWVGTDEVGAGLLAAVRCRAGKVACVCVNP